MFECKKAQLKTYEWYMEKAPYTADTPMIIVETGMIQKFKALLDILNRSSYVSGDRSF